MTLELVTKEAYTQVLGVSYHAFGTSVFNSLNDDLGYDILYILFKDTKYRLGIVGGVRDNGFCSPFSAPFGGFSFVEEHVTILQIEQAIIELKKMLSKKSINLINISLPPLCYNSNFISKQIIALRKCGLYESSIELNFFFRASSFSDSYTSMIWRNARKNLNRAVLNKLTFSTDSSLEFKKRAFQIIKENRKQKRYPLRMTWERVFKTLSVVSADFFIVQDSLGFDVASAMVFYINPKVVQVIYWGDLPQYSNLRAMNFLAFKVFEFYKSIGVEIVDIGPSTENGIPNYGLCEFKESIGCDLITKSVYSGSIDSIQQR